MHSTPLSSHIAVAVPVKQMGAAQQHLVARGETLHADGAAPLLAGNRDRLDIAPRILRQRHDGGVPGLNQAAGLRQGRLELANAAEKNSAIWARTVANANRF